MKSFLRKPFRISLVVVGCYGLVFLALSGELPLTPGHSTLSTETGHVGRGWPEQFQDSATEAELEFVKTQLPALIAKDTGLSSFSREQIKDPEWLSAYLEGASIQEAAEKIWKPSMVQHRVDEVKAGIELVATETDPKIYTANSFTVTRWMGIDVNERSGRAVFEGQHSYYSNGEWFRDAVLRWEVEFEIKGEAAQSVVLLGRITGFRESY
ncbi:MAG: hypothetical protein ACKOWP_03780 [Microbacteriaceae bacterium]